MVNGHLISVTSSSTSCPTTYSTSSVLPDDSTENLTPTIIIEDLLEYDFVLVLVYSTGFDNLLMSLLLVLVSIHFDGLTMLDTVRHLIHKLCQLGSVHLTTTNNTSRIVGTLLESDL